MAEKYIIVRDDEVQGLGFVQSDYVTRQVNLLKSLPLNSEVSFTNVFRSWDCFNDYENEIHECFNICLGVFVRWDDGSITLEQTLDSFTELRDDFLSMSLEEMEDAFYNIYVEVEEHPLDTSP